MHFHKKELNTLVYVIPLCEWKIRKLRVFEIGCRSRIDNFIGLNESWDPKKFHNEKNKYIVPLPIFQINFLGGYSNFWEAKLVWEYQNVLEVQKIYKSESRLRLRRKYDLWNLISFSHDIKIGIVMAMWLLSIGKWCTIRQVIRSRM